MTRIAIAAAIALVATTGIASAQDRGWGWGAGGGYGYRARQAERQAEIDRRQARQQDRIDRGVRSGEITRSEYARLQAEQARIRQLEAQAKSDGRISRYEAWQIRRAQDEASRHIRNEKHDADRVRRY